MADVGGRISPVQATFATPLTVDEVEEVLSRRADRGNLFVESLVGALFYRIPREQRVSGSG